MNPTKFLLLITGILTLASCKTMDTNHSKPLAQSREYYQLKIFTFDTDEQVQTTDNYLKEAYLPGLKRLGIQNIGVFKPSPDGTDSVKKILILVPFSSLAQFLTLEEELGKDQTYLSAGQDYIGVSHQHPPYSRFESILLKAFEDMPAMQASKLDGPRANRIYELRSYESPTEAYFKNKVDMFNAGGEIKLFERLGFNAVFYAEVISGPKMPNLMYMTTFSGLSSREEHWKEFGEAPEWKKLKAMPKYMNNVSHIDITYLYPTEYSDY